MICSNCAYANDCVMFQFAGTGLPITACYKFKEKQQTNADRIRSMTDEELAEEMNVRLSEDCLMCPVLEADCPVWDATKKVECKDAMLDWLKQEVEE